MKITQNSIGKNEIVLHSRSLSLRLPALMLLFLVAQGSLLGCLQTRGGVKEADEKQQIRKQVQNLQQTTADVNSRFNDIDEEFRKTYGRVEQIDVRLTQIKERAEKNDFALEAKVKEQDQKLAAYREELTKLASDLAEMRGQLEAARQALLSGATAAAGAATSGGAAAPAKNSYELALSKFEAKAWRDAILAFEDYRKTYPRGKNIIPATYRIGLCFQELGMNDEAKAFFEEVIQKAPNSKEAGFSKTRLKELSAKKKG
jgi:TolA-binding protein